MLLECFSSGVMRRRDAGWGVRPCAIYALCALVLVAPAQALEIDPNVVPEINVGGRAIATVNFHREDRAAAGNERESELDIADSSLLFGFSKYLFSDNDYGFAVVGFKLPEDDTDLKDDVYFHELHVGVGGKRYEVKLGRSRLGNTLIQFPTLRDDDLLTYTHVPNGSSNADAEEYQQFGGVATATWWITPTASVDAGFTARTRTDAAGERDSSSDFNGGYLGIAYDAPEAVTVDRGIRYAGLRIDAQDAEIAGLGLPSERIKAVIGAVSFNLGDNPEATWDLDLQLIANDGVAVPDLASEVGRSRAKSKAAVMAVRYGHRPALQTRWQFALNLAWKDYSDFDEASSYVLAPSYIYRLGSGVEFLAQYSYTDYDATLAAALGREKKQRISVGLQFAFDHTFNESVGERKSILNLEHNTLDFGPAGGGH